MLRKVDIFLCVYFRFYISIKFWTSFVNDSIIICIVIFQGFWLILNYRILDSPIFVLLCWLVRLQQIYSTKINCSCLKKESGLAQENMKNHGGDQQRDFFIAQASENP